MKFKKIIVLFLSTICIIAFSGCDSLTLSGPEKALKNFETSFNERDIEGIIDVFKPSEQSKLKLQLELSKGVANIAGGVFGVDGIGDLFSTDILSGLFGIAAEDNYITIEVISEEYSEDNNSVVVSAKIIFGESEEICEIPMVKISGKWYLDEDFY